MKRRVLIAVLFAVWGLLPANLLALDQKTIDERIKQMQMMSKVDRDRLDRNIQAFQGLSNTQKTQYRSLHEELAEDRAHAGGLSALLQTYAAWVQSLSPAQRDEIQHASDAAQKLTIIRRIKEENEHPKASHESHHDEPPPRPNLKFPPKYALDSKDLAAVIKVIVESLPADRVKDEFNQPALNYYLPIINVSSQLVPNYREWPDEGMVQRMTVAIRNKDSAATISKASSKREAMVRLILTGIMRQVNDLVRYPTEEEIQTHESLTPAERQKIMSHHREEAEWQITKKFFEAKGDDSFMKIPIYRRQVIELFEKLEVSPPPQLSRPKSRALQGKG